MCRMMHNGETGRTPIYLGDEELELLDRVAQATGASRSALIRRAIHSTFGERTATERLRALEASAGWWNRQRRRGVDFVDATRVDLNERLAQQGFS